MKLALPQIPAQLETGSLEQLLSGDDLEAVAFRDVAAAARNIAALDIEGVVMEKVSLMQAQLLRISARDWRVDKCDLSSASLADGSVSRAEFGSCRMTGLDCSKMTLRDVVFRGCKLDLANFRYARLQRVQFVDCTLVETDFLGAALHDVAFQACVLEKTVFEQAKCTQVDLRSSELGELVGWSSLKGAAIDGLQLVTVAPYLAQTLGLVVK